MIEYRIVAALRGDFEKELLALTDKGFRIIGYSAAYDPGLGNPGGGAITHCALLEGDLR